MKALPVAFALLVPALLTACGGGGGGGGGDRFAFVSTNGLQNGSVWQINRPIQLTFTQPVDLSSAHLGSVQIFEQVGGVPALGTFYLLPGSADRTLVFQPLCPTNDSFDNGDLRSSARARGRGR